MTILEALGRMLPTLFLALSAWLCTVDGERMDFDYVAVLHVTGTLLAEWNSASHVGQAPPDAAVLEAIYRTARNNDLKVSGIVRLVQDASFWYVHISVDGQLAVLARSHASVPLMKARFLLFTVAVDLRLALGDRPATTLERSLSALFTGTHTEWRHMERVCNLRWPFAFRLALLTGWFVRILTA